MLFRFLKCLFSRARQCSSERPRESWGKTTLFRGTEPHEQRLPGCHPRAGVPRGVVRVVRGDVPFRGAGARNAALGWFSMTSLSKRTALPVLFLLCLLFQGSGFAANKLTNVSVAETPPVGEVSGGRPWGCSLCPARQRALRSQLCPRLGGKFLINNN